MQDDKCNRTRWNGLILAGGRSRRMGRDKALLIWQGRPLLAHMRDLLRQAGAGDVVISGDYPEYDGIRDVEPDRGPMSALAQLLPRLADGLWIVVPVDMPRLDADLLGTLAASATACTCLRDHPLPMALRIDDVTRRTIEVIGERGGRACSFRALRDALPSRILEGERWRDQLNNCNTPEQWRELQGFASARETR